VTIWPRKHKRKTPLQAFTRSKQIYRIGQSLKFCGTVHCWCYYNSHRIRLNHYPTQSCNSTGTLPPPCPWDITWQWVGRETTWTCNARESFLSTLLSSRNHYPTQSSNSTVTSPCPSKPLQGSGEGGGPGTCNAWSLFLSTHLSVNSVVLLVQEELQLGSCLLRCCLRHCSMTQ